MDGELGQGLGTIGFVDLRDGGPVHHVRERRDRAQAMRRDCAAWLPFALLLPAMPLLDRLARRWFMRSRSPYLGELEAVAATLGFSGTWFLNGSYQWGCTTLARDESGMPWLARTLDWPLPGMGRHADVAHMRGAAGDFFSVTWPGYVGVLTAMAPGRFAAAINQAPMRRRSHAPLLRFVDLAANAVNTWRHVRHIPPDQLLRQVFETCASYTEAKAQLESVPVARPVIYTLVGCEPGQRCVIERTEEDFRTRTELTCAANDWQVADADYEGRLGPRAALTASYADARENSRCRSDALAAWNGSIATDSFAWVTPPMLNHCTRLAVEMCAANATLRVVGYEVPRGAEIAQPATLPCELPAERAAA
jgi:hypothetical protein